MTETSFTPMVFKLPTSNNKLNYKNDILISSNVPQPKISLGFHSFQQRTKSALSIIDTLETKKKFYNIVHDFDPETLSNNKDIMTDGYFKFFEMLSLFDIASKDKIVFGTIGEGIGSYVQAFIDFRKKYFKVDNDKIHTVTLKPEKEDNFQDLNKKYLNRVKKEYPDLITPHKTSVKSVTMKYKGKDNGDITDFKTIANFKKDLKDKADLVTAHASKHIYNKIYQEQENYNLILAEIISATSVLKKDGHFVLKMFDTFTNVSIKLLYILSSMFEEVYVYKPFTSFNSDDEKYIICKSFKSLDMSKELTELLEKMGTDKFVNDIYTDMDIPDSYIDMVRFININLVNKQQITINKIVTFIKSNNYFGDEYHQYKENQESCHKFWNKTFNSDNLVNVSLLKDQLSYIDSEFKLFKSNIV
jgi:hypothetical protein